MNQPVNKVPPAGLEPGTSWLFAGRLYQLSHELSFSFKVRVLTLSKLKYLMKKERGVSQTYGRSEKETQILTLIT